MSSSSIFSFFSGILMAVFLLLLFGEKPRIALMNRSQWLADHPRGYVLAIVLSAVALLSIGYLLSVKFP